MIRLQWNSPFVTTVHDHVRAIRMPNLFERIFSGSLLAMIGCCVIANAFSRVAMADQPANPQGTVRVILSADTPSERAPHGGGNIYAPEVHHHGDAWQMWYGAQGTDGHDRIHFAESTDGRRWVKKGVVIDCGTANHVNDPSVVRVNSQWWMFYTVAQTAEDDEIAAAVSTDGLHWKELGVVLATGDALAWDSKKVGRPTVLFEDGRFRLWYDGQPTTAAAEQNETARRVLGQGRAVGYAESSDGQTWTRRAEPVFLHGAGAVDVERLDGRYVLVYESHSGVYGAESRDGLEWTSPRRWLATSGREFDQHGHVTPQLMAHDDQRWDLYVGAASRPTWDGNSIAVATISQPKSEIKTASLQKIQLTCVDEHATGYGTFQSHNQKVVANGRGYFMTHIRTRNEDYTAQQWRLSWSTDQGRSFRTLYEATHATNPPVMETDDHDNLYLIRSDFQDGHAYLYRFLADRNYRDPLVTKIPDGAAGKYSMAIDLVRRQLYYFAHNNSFHLISLDGKVLSQFNLLQPGANALLQYPHLFLDSQNTLHAAWTTQKHGIYLYWDIHYLQSSDGGKTWQTMSGQNVPLPVIADEGGPAERITLDDESDHHTWLSSFAVRKGIGHFLYLAQTPTPRQHYVQYELGSGQRKLDVWPEVRGQQLQVRNLDGYFVLGPDHTSDMFIVSRDAKSSRLACLVSTDHGQSWSDYGVSDQVTNPYSIGGFRKVTADNAVIGSFTDQIAPTTDTGGGSKVYFFRMEAKHRPASQP
ncbi:MAG: hypothetical protein R3C28_15760 [Pirellulaceae bacterium]